MTKTTSYQKTIKEFFEKSMILISDDYSYGYTQEECKNLWNELLNFNLPNADYKKFNIYDELQLIQDKLKLSATLKNSQRYFCLSKFFTKSASQFNPRKQKLFFKRSKDASGRLTNLEISTWELRELKAISLIQSKTIFTIKIANFLKEKSMNSQKNHMKDFYIS